MTATVEPGATAARAAGGRARATGFAGALAGQPASNNLVLRKQQLDRLKNHAEVRLIVAQAPAGFG
ncbi:MAG: hypothetical protein WD671_06520, partial [Parvibaculum sp.]